METACRVGWPYLWMDSEIEAEERPEVFNDLKDLNEKTDEASSLDKGFFEHGCAHYKRRCKVRAPCCNEIFDCRHCHNESKAAEVDPSKRHELPRFKIEKVICCLCETEQKVQQNCENCGVCMGRYFCGRCNFFDDDVQTSCCYTVKLKNEHLCVENSMQHNCPVCFEYLFDSLRDITVLNCGHTMHLECLNEMRSHTQYTCPMCSKSVCDMSEIWEELDREIAATPMPEEYQNKLVWILCNDCGANSEVLFHIIAQKCRNCKSYNTRQTKGRGAASSTSGE